MSLSLSLMPPWTRSAAPCALTPPKFWLADGSTTRTNPASAVAALHEPERVPGAFGLSNLLVMPLLPAEYFQLGQGEPADDLLGGL